ncbi:TAXI family TRAP transporter solute-binding subunit [Zobellella maritima]|uniref:TAXI family TRAP transporter solute-binding subunit n=1 Tax=Zobellella maritima TaxID=2059725 RepID=UPI000E300263|nr:TAXI family TRAP transporter solute-binding subunit [Zobellella maritima]
MNKKLLVAATLTLSTALSGCDMGGSKANIAIGPAASTTQKVSRMVLGAYGIEDADYNAYQERFGDALDGVQDGNIDISMGIMGLPAGSIESLQAASGDVRMLSLSDEVVEQIESTSDYRRFIIGKDSYKFLEQDVQTIAAFAVLMGNTNTISEEMGYQLAKVMYDNADQITHSQAKFLTLEHALNGGDALKIHPGAKRFYEEKGLTVTLPVAELGDITAKDEFILGTGSQGGTYYPLGGEIATTWNNNIPGANFTNVETSASIENLVSIRDGKMDLGMSVHVPARNALEGKAEFAGAAVDNAAFIGQIYPEVVQIVSREGSKVSSFDSIKAK